MNNENQVKLFERFLQFETDFNLFNYQLYDIKIWHLFRGFVFDEIFKKEFQYSPPHDGLKAFKLLPRLKIFIREFLKWSFNNFKINPQHHKYLFLNHSRRVKVGLTYECIYTDLLIRELNASSIILEEPYFSKTNLFPIATINVFYTGINGIFSKLYYIIFRQHSLTTKDIMTLNEIAQFIESNFNLNKKYIFKNFAKILIISKLKLKFYERLLTKIKPQIIIQVISYGFSKFLINHIAKKMGIPTVELQHGTMGKYHIAYNFKDKIKLTTFPDYVFTFGQFWKDTTRFPISNENIKVLGWPYFEKKVSYYKDKFKNNNIKTILFISQGTIGVELSKEAVKLSELLNNNYRIIYKLHPGEYVRWKNSYPWLKNTLINVIDNNDNDIHYYFSQSDFQVGVDSTSLFEGLAYNLKTYIFPFFGSFNMSEFVKKNNIETVNNSYELFNSIQKFDFNTIYDVNDFWEKDSLKKIILEIDLIIENYKNHLK
jgi:hypothetical protein